MKTITTLILSFFAFSASTFPSDQIIPAIEHLSEVNKEWLTNSIHAPKTDISFSNDKERISYHLLNVESILRRKENDHLSNNQLQKRIEMLDILHQYALDMQFPINTYHSDRQPYFIDIFGTHCAVGYLVMKSGFSNISQSISKTQNYAYVREIESPELVQWSIDYGFSLDELAWIQPTYPDNTHYTQISSGTNGRVIAIERHLPQHGGDTYIAGNFTMLGDIPCLNVAKYDGSQLTCLAGGVEGKVNDMKITLYEGGTVYLAGAFEHQDTIFPLAKYHDGEWTYISIPGVIEATSINLSTGFYFYVGCKDDNGMNSLKLYDSFSNNWITYGVVNGTINTISVTSSGSGGIAFAGKFDQIVNRYVDWDSDLFPTIYDTVPTNNVAIVNFYYDSVFDDYLPYCTGVVGGSMPDTVFTSVGIGHNFYFGGSGSLNSGNSDILLTKVNNIGVIPLIKLSVFYYLTEKSQAIYDMEFNSSTSELIIGGNLSDLESNEMYTYWGKNLYKYQISSGSILSKGYFNDYVYAVENSFDKLIVGGDFKGKYLGENSMLHIAQTAQNLSLEENNLLSNISLYPNPVSSEFQILGIINKPTLVEIIDSQGKIVVPRSIYNQSVSIGDISQGIYFVNIIQEDETIAVIRLLKN